MFTLSAFKLRMFLFLDDYENLSLVNTYNTGKNPCFGYISQTVTHIEYNLKLFVCALHLVNVSEHCLRAVDYFTHRNKNLP